MTSRFEVVHESPYYRVEVVSPGRLIRVTRFARPFESRQAVNLACAPVQEVLDRLGRADHVLLIDTRSAVGNNNPEYEQWFERHRKLMISGFPRVGLLTKTFVGRLHVDRLIEQDGVDVRTRVFQDEEQALRFLLDE